MRRTWSSISKSFFSFQIFKYKSENDTVPACVAIIHQGGVQCRVMTVSLTSPHLIKHPVFENSEHCVIVACAKKQVAHTDGYGWWPGTHDALTCTSKKKIKITLFIGSRNEAWLRGGAFLRLITFLPLPNQPASFFLLFPYQFTSTVLSRADQRITSGSL